MPSTVSASKTCGSMSISLAKQLIAVAFCASTTFSREAKVIANSVLLNGQEDTVLYLVVRIILNHRYLRFSHYQRERRLKMTPTRLFEICSSEQDEVDLKEKVESYKRLDSGAIEMKLKSGKEAVFRIDPRSKKKFLMIQWR